MVTALVPRIHLQSRHCWPASERRSILSPSTKRLSISKRIERRRSRFDMTRSSAWATRRGRVMARQHSRRPESDLSCHPQPLEQSWSLETCISRRRLPGYMDYKHCRPRCSRRTVRPASPLGSQLRTLYAKQRALAHGNAALPYIVRHRRSSSAGGKSLHLVAHDARDCKLAF